MNSEVTTLLKAFTTSRRQFVRATAIAGGLMAAGGLAPSSVAGLAIGRAAAQEGGDLGVLNYALTLEHFENALYRDLIAGGLLSGQSLAYAKTFGDHENTHVIALTDTIKKLGGTPVEEQTSYNWPKLSTESQVVDLLVTIEDVGASAYLGAAPLVKSDDLLTVAVQIHTVEAYHATGWRLKAKGNSQYAVPFAFAEGRTMAQVIEIVTPFLVGMPATGAGGTSSGRSGMATAVGVAGVGVAVAAGAGLATKREAVKAE